MITANEAKALYDASNIEVILYLKHTIDPVVRKAAQEGNRKCFILIDSKPLYHPIAELTAIELGVVSELKKLGYTVVTALAGFSIPLCQIDNDFAISSHQNYGFFISW